MIDIWKFEGEKNVRLTSTDGRIVEGKVIDVIDAEDKEDETEDSICIENKNGIFEFPQSEVKDIQIMK